MSRERRAMEPPEPPRGPAPDPRPPRARRRREGGFFARGSRFAPHLALLLTSPLAPGPSASGAGAEHAQGAGPITPSPADLPNLSLDELTRVQFVTSVSKRPERLADAAAAIHVITGEDISRSGATTIADALRESPGIFAGKVDSHTWALSSRGFNDAFGNKLLVLMDGRSLYTPLFSGVYWDVQDTMLEDVDRIEVVRGPGATLWGANAVNGVINIISRSARETQGTLATAGGGIEETAFAAIRHGGQINSNAFYRVYVKYDNRDSSQLLASPEAADDRWWMLRAGFRTDWEPSARDQFTLQGDVYEGEADQTWSYATLTPPDYRSVESRETIPSGGNILGRWTRTLAQDSSLQVQSYYDRANRDLLLLDEERDTFDLDVQHLFPLGEHQNITWGAGYRFTRDQLRDSFTLSFDRESRSDNLFSLFGQDVVTLWNDHLHLTAGTKLEHNDYTGFEYQPRVSLQYRANDQHSLWASVSRAVRTPSRAEHDIRLNDQVYAGAPPTVVSIFGHEGFRSETVLAWEAGYRFNPGPRFHADLAVFYNQYRHLRTTEQFGTPGLDPSLPGSPIVQPVRIDNLADGETYGAEFSGVLQITERWHLHGAYSLLEMQIHRRASSNAGDAEIDEDRAPHHQVSLHSSMDLPASVRLDLIGRYVDAIPDFNIPPYWSLDARIAWRPRPNLELSLTGRNLFDDRRPEFWPTILGTQRTEVQRAIFGKVELRF